MNDAIVATAEGVVAGLKAQELRRNIRLNAAMVVAERMVLEQRADRERMSARKRRALFAHLRTLGKN